MKRSVFRTSAAILALSKVKVFRAKEKHRVGEAMYHEYVGENNDLRRQGAFLSDVHGNELPSLEGSWTNRESMISIGAEPMVHCCGNNVSIISHCPTCGKLASHVYED